MTNGEDPSTTAADDPSMTNGEAVDDDARLRELLSADTVAVVGCSTTPGKDAHDVPKYLQDRGYRVVPINPYADEVLGETAYDSLSDVPSEIHVDLVDVFRPSEEVSGVVDDVLDRLADVGDVGAVWLQPGIRDDHAATRAAATGIDVVQDRCIRNEHRRLLG